ncbi:hypothetical protein [Pleionea sp. CnH1-48]|uniref:hypothetical protein n=1 Tax=Pleionea sp. CnH1-48 TaxID=2954494 RepID=UPI0020982289|nr:hypothetical protein [Pleionea sp. CnH1-48]MCO7222702.1 hypothetical protein [Pleionea sp. CnH1-48]
MKPFRWNLKKREQLGNLLKYDAEVPFSGYVEELSDCAAKVVARSSGRRLIFVGRSPENIFDYLSGVFDGTNYENKVELLNISNRFGEINDIKGELPHAYDALKEHFIELELSPNQIISQSNGLCFSDLVAGGNTFQRLFEFLQLWTYEEKQDFPALVRKLSFVGITYMKKNSPNTWRWQQHADWVKEHSQLKVKNVSIPWWLWDYLGNRQSKVAYTNQPESWASKDILMPPRDISNIEALRLAYLIYTLGLEQKKGFSEKLSLTQEVKESWLRSLVRDLRKSIKKL